MRHFSHTIIFFDILLVFVSSLQTFYDIYFFQILFFYFFPLQINFCIYLFLCLLIFLSHFHNNLLLYLVLHICFLIITCINHFLYTNKKIQNTVFINQIRIVHYANRIIFAHIPKVNSVSISFNISNSNIIKTHSFCIKSWQPLQRYGSYLKPISLKYQ